MRTMYAHQHFHSISPSQEVKGMCKFARLKIQTCTKGDIRMCGKRNQGRHWPSSICIASCRAREKQTRDKCVDLLTANEIGPENCSTIHDTK